MRRCWPILAALSAAALGAEEIPLFPADGKVEHRVWNMASEVRDARLLLNRDQRGAPWAGMLFDSTAKDRPLLVLTDEWIAAGFVRFEINALEDPYGKPAAPCEFQLRLIGCTDRYQRVPARCYAGGRGIDADLATWQAVLVPIKLFSVKPGGRVTAVGLQCVGKPQAAFGVGAVSLVHLAEPPAEEATPSAADVAQPTVAWPAWDALPAELKLPRNLPRYQGGKFVTADGRRAFLMMPWSREDQRLNLGINAEGRACPSFGLFDRTTQGFIYEQPLDARSMARVGFNCYASQVDPRPFWTTLGYAATHSPHFTHEHFLSHVRQMGYPFYVDMVCFPWTLGKPADDAKAALPDGVLHNGRHHWTPYRIIGKGRETWLSMWRIYARRYKDAGAAVLFYELMNEPAYTATTPDHRQEFVAWLKKRYATLERVNATWGTAYASWEAIRGFKSPRDCAGVFFDYDDYLAERFAGLIQAGRDAVEAITPGVPAAIQTMGGYTLQPREAVHLAKLIPIERAVLTPTGGGRWTRNVPNARPAANTLDYAIGPAPIANDLLLAMAGEKMIVDNEMYLGSGQTRQAMRDRWWKAVLAGIDGCAWFSWSKRGWAWWKGPDNIRREADLFPYSGLIPFARRAGAIRGVLDFATEIERVRDLILEKPWGPPPRVALLYSWANARWPAWEPKARDRTGHAHAAMRYLHWNLTMAPTHLPLPDAELLVVAGTDHIEPEALERLRRFAQDGGTLVVADSLLDRDPYGKPLDPTPLLGVGLKGRQRVEPGAFRLVGLPEVPLLPGTVDRAAARIDVELRPGAEAIARDAAGRPVVVRRRLGKGSVVFVAADLRGYALAKVLAAVRGTPGTLAITDARTGQLAPNVLVSRRSYADRHALVLLNTDPFPKLIRIRLAGLDGQWQACDPLEGRSFPDAADVTCCLAGSGRGLVLITRQPWTRNELAPAPAAAMKAQYDKELASWQQSR